MPKKAINNYFKSYTFTTIKKITLIHVKSGITIKGCLYLSR